VSNEKADVVGIGGLEDSVMTVVVPDCVMVVSLHVVSMELEVGTVIGTELKVTTVVVPDCVIVLSLQVVSQE
jgi:hypothetical protein